MQDESIQNDVDIETPEPPFELSERAREIWGILFPLLAVDGAVASQDHWLLARYCETQAEWEEHNRFRRANKVFKEMTSGKGVKYFAKHPEISRLETIEQLLPRMEKQLGIGAKNTGEGGKPVTGLESIIERLLKR